MKNKIIKFLTISTIAILTTNANAQTLNVLIDNIMANGHLFSVSRIIEGFVYLTGIGLGIKGIFKLNEWSESKGRNAKISTSLIYIVCAGLMMGLPSVINMGTGTIFGQAAKQNFSSGSGQYGGTY